MSDDLEKEGCYVSMLTNCFRTFWKNFEFEFSKRPTNSYNGFSGILEIFIQRGKSHTTFVKKATHSKTTNY